MDDPWIAPHHRASEQGVDADQWPLDFMIEVFYDRIDGWHLGVAQQALTCIPDAGWAALQIAISYFEVAGFFTCNCVKGSPKTRFREGLYNVFPELKKETSDISEMLWDNVRNRLYHTGIRLAGTKRKQAIRINAWEGPAFYQDNQLGVFVIDPHKVIPRMREHLQRYVETLQDSTNIQQREDFVAAFKVFYKG